VRILVCWSEEIGQRGVRSAMSISDQGAPEFASTPRPNGRGGRPGKMIAEAQASSELKPP
jgi:hypothetical protein